MMHMSLYITDRRNTTKLDSSPAQLNDDVPCLHFSRLHQWCRNAVIVLLFIQVLQNIMAEKHKFAVLKIIVVENILLAEFPFNLQN